MPVDPSHVPRKPKQGFAYRVIGYNHEGFVIKYDDFTNIYQAAMAFEYMLGQRQSKEPPYPEASNAVIFNSKGENPY